MLIDINLLIEFNIMDYYIYVKDYIILNMKYIKFCHFNKR